MPSPMIVLEARRPPLPPPGPAEPRPAGRRAARDSTAPSDQTAAPTVLLVSRDADVLFICRSIFEHNGFRVLETDDSRVASLAREERPDLILLDIIPPLQDGWRLARSLKADPDLLDTPLMVLTVDTRDQARTAARQTACDSYLIKPFSPMEVIWEARQLLRPGTISVQQRA